MTTDETMRDPIDVKVGAGDVSIISMGEEVLSAAEGSSKALVLDCCSDAEWLGETTGAHEVPQKSRVPRTYHLNWELLVDGNGRLLGVEQLRTLSLAAGLDGSQAVFPYCGGELVCDV
jgi:3-mercaptopyruvate sulfurtransferase SseA